jgi:polysaccharide pyruvyl transferase WcaK-like protein
MKGRWVIGLARMDGLIGLRLHAAILAGTGLSSPTRPLANSPKVLR